MPETLDRAYLEYATITKARNRRELVAKAALQKAKSTLNTISTKGHSTDYDWNADPEQLTLLEGDTFKAIDFALKLLEQ